MVGGAPIKRHQDIIEPRAFLLAKMTMTSPFYPVSTKKRIDALKSLWGKSIHGERSLTEDRSYNVKLVAVGGATERSKGY